MKTYTPRELSYLNNKDAWDALNYRTWRELFEALAGPADDGPRYVSRDGGRTYELVT